MPLKQVGGAKAYSEDEALRACSRLMMGETKLQNISAVISGLRSENLAVLEK